MKFIKNLSKKEYTEFWEKTYNNHFLQSYGWGQASYKNRKQEPFYVGLKNDNDEVVAAALLLKTILPLGYCYFYSPRGFTVDFNNLEVLSMFTEELRKFLKSEKAIYLKMDPPVKYQTIDLDANKIDGDDNYKLFNDLINLGYKHKGFNKLYEGNQPRYTFRTYFNKQDSVDKINASISKSYMRNIKRSYNYDINISQSDDIKVFHDLIKIISDKNKFHEYSFDYYQNVFDELIKNNLIKIFSASLNPSKLVDKFTKDLENEKNNDRINKLKKDIEFFSSLDNQDEHVICSLICTYSKTGSWSLYIGNDHTAEVTCTINRLYYEFIIDAFNNGYEYADLFGTVGDPKTKFKNLAGIFEHKRMLGGDYIEFIGEFDLVNKKLMYSILPLVLKIYRKFK